jgi:cytochrome c
MTRRGLHVAACLSAVLFGSAPAGSAPAGAAERGTPEEALALLRRAVALVEREGPKKAIAAFNDPKGGFVDRDLYVFCMGPDYKMKAHVDPGMRGVDVATLKDPDGKEIGRKIIELSQKGGGTLAYRWVNPVSKKVEDKVSFLEKAGPLFCGVGAYK